MIVFNVTTHFMCHFAFLVKSINIKEYIFYRKKNNNTTL